MNCTGKTDLFFDDRRTSQAKKVCEGCPALIACLERGIAYEEYGVWGGTSAAERVQIRKARNVTVQPIMQVERPDHPSCGTPYGYARIRRLEPWKSCPKCNKAHAEYTRETARRRAQARSLTSV